MKNIIGIALVVLVASMAFSGILPTADASNPGEKPPKDNKYPGGKWEFQQTFCKLSTNRNTCEQAAKAGGVSCPEGEEVSKVDCNSGDRCVVNGAEGNNCNCSFNCKPKKKSKDAVVV
ncbi:MAG: hypothetical protein Q8Q42_02965 [Nanoarchaeota archaeon]|nr:hypothetical protein [Nanoarchaeota archaeon]